MPRAFLEAGHGIIPSVRTCTIVFKFSFFLFLKFFNEGATFILCTSAKEGACFLLFTRQHGAIKKKKTVDKLAWLHWPSVTAYYTEQYFSFSALFSSFSFL